MKGRYVYNGLIEHLEPNQIFVFGSNPLIIYPTRDR